MMNEQKNSAVNVPIYIFTALAIGILGGFAYSKISSGKSFTNRGSSGELNDVLHYINEKYVDSVDVAEIEQKAIVKALEELDPHSVYIPKEELQASNEQMEGSYEGVGIQFFIKEDTINVDSVIGGGPSEEVGIRGGDKIITINDSTVAGIGIENNDVIRLLKGKKGTSVEVGIQRHNSQDLLDFSITREPIKLNSLDAGYMLTDNIGYIKLNKFSTTTYKEFQIELMKLVDEGMQDLILDLRGNSGGILKDAIQILDMLIDGKKTLLVVEGRKYKREEFQALLEGLFEEGRIAVLVNEGSASASEIVAGTIQDWDRGVVIGRRTFGKGLVQQPFNLSDGSGLRLTVARYYTPSGRSIQRSYEKGKDNYYNDFYKRSDELLHKDSIKVDSSLIKYTLKNRREVYGGGGITPDVFIPLDTTSYNEFYTDALAKRYASEFVYDYVDENNKVLQGYRNAEEFDEEFFINDNTYNKFIDFVKENEPEKQYTTNDISTSKEEVSEFIKALIAKQLFQQEGYFIVMNDSDEAVLKAMKILSSSEYDTILNSSNKTK